MAVNLDKPHRWKADIAASVDMYNEWFLRFAPSTFRKTRVTATASVESSLVATSYLRDVSPETVQSNPKILSTLRMATCPPLAVDRLIGLANVNPSLVKRMEVKGTLPARMPAHTLNTELRKIGDIIQRMADPDILVWLPRGDDPTEQEIHRAATVIADRLCAAQANPVIRNEQEKRQLLSLKGWLESRGYTQIDYGCRVPFQQMKPGTFSFRLNVKVDQLTGTKQINIPVDAVIMPIDGRIGDLPLLLEAKSAGDFTNTNKRRKEEATKMAQLRHTYGGHVRLILFLCGYFDSGYLGYEAAEGIDWVWEHRIEDMAELGL